MHEVADRISAYADHSKNRSFQVVHRSEQKTKLSSDFFATRAQAVQYIDHLIEMEKFYGIKLVERDVAGDPISMEKFTTYTLQDKLNEQ